MSYKIVTSGVYQRHLKDLADKHRSLKKDIEKLYNTLEENPHQGILIMENVYKIRLAITSKGRGKSGGARVITYTLDDLEKLILLDIFDKSEEENISKKRIQTIIDSFDFDEEE